MLGDIYYVYDIYVYIFVYLYILVVGFLLKEFKYLETLIIKLNQKVLEAVTCVKSVVFCMRVLNF